MTNLTEKLKKGELQSGYHYVKVIPEFEYSYDIAFYTGGYFELYSNDDIEQVLTLVPNYEQWQAKLEENANLQAELKKVCIRTIDFNIYNSQLKGLLKEVLRHELSLKEVTELTRKISEVLGDSRK